MSGFLTALADFWRVDNKHGLYPQKDSFNFKINYSGVIYFMLTVSMLATAIFFCIRWCRMVDIVFNKETVQIYRENCKELNKLYDENCEAMHGNVKWIGEKFDELFKDKFGVTPISVKVDKRGTQVLVKTGMKKITCFSSAIFEEYEIRFEILVNFNNELDFVFYI